MDETPNRHRSRIAVAVGLFAILSCGDGTTTGPPHPPPVPTPPSVPPPPQPAALTVTPSAVRLVAIDQTAQLAAEVRDQSGQVMTGVAVAWSSSDGGVAAVDSAGLVSATGQGAATVTASAGDVSGTAEITVAQEVSAISVSPAAARIEAVGDTVRLVAEPTDANGHPVVGAVIRWSSSDESVAVVDSAGLVSATGQGAATVTASAGDVSGTTQIIVAEAADRRTLKTLYETTGGADWTNGDNWLTRAPIGEWHGVEVDVAGRVIGLALAGNNLTGWIPPEVGDLDRLRYLHVDRNALGGPLPPELAGATGLTSLRIGDNLLSGPLPRSLLALSPEEFRYADTGLCVPPYETFRNWLGNIASHDGTDVECAPPTDREILVQLYEATDGPNWENRNKWLTGAPLGEWHGVTADAGGRVRALNLAGNNLHGTMPPELGGLSNLQRLDMRSAGLTGRIPPELGQLRQLRVLWVSHNTFVGGIPPEIRNASNLQDLDLFNNSLTGTIPGELGRLTRLESLDLGWNHLSGTLPSALGDLARLQNLRLDRNLLAGPMPASLLQLELSAFNFDQNPGLCAPGTARFVSWLGRIAEVRGEYYCNADDIAVLRRLHESAGGAGWTRSDGWLASQPLDGWYGVVTDTIGYVRALDLSRNGLVGTLPPELGELAGLTALRIGGNALSGPLPFSLARLRLRELRYAGTELCVPSGGGLQEWLGTVSSHEGTGLECAASGDRAVLETLYRSLGGSNWRRRGGWLSDQPLGTWAGVRVDGDGRVVGLNLSGNNLSGRIPADLGNLSRLEELLLHFNRLDGEIPPELGGLANLTSLYLWGNELSGTVPPSFAQLDRLRHFYIGRNGVCVPGTSALARWLQGVENHDAAARYCNATDVAVLKSLYGAADGPGWTQSSGWLGEEGVADWHGVTADSVGRVTQLDLTRNGLRGRLPAQLGALARMTVLRLGGNAISGRLPLSLTRLSLQELGYADTGLCAPVETAFQTWLRGIPTREGTGIECGPLSDRETLEILYGATGGPAWARNEGWLTDAPLAEWYGVEVNDDSRVVGLELPSNHIEGRIPPELGSLAHLTRLDLSLNSLSGPIPAELGGLTGLTLLDLRRNRLTGPIPSELGGLTSLRMLALGINALKGPIPAALGSLSSLERLYLGYNDLAGRLTPELGSLTGLTWLELQGNDLSGPIPPEFGNLSSITRLFLHDNRLTGPLPPGFGGLATLEVLSLRDNDFSDSIPAALGTLSSLTHLVLGGNDLSGPLPLWLGGLPMLESLGLDNNELTGPVPAAFGRMTTLQELSLSNNRAMAGPLPADLAALDRLGVLLAGGTELCVPSDPGFHTWLAGVHKRRIASCVEGDLPTAYLTQAVQSRRFPVPLVAGRKALLRVFPVAGRATSEGLPAIRARFYRDGRETHVEDIPATAVPIPTRIDESNLSTSANAEIPGDVIQPGLEMVIEVDPAGTLDPGLGVSTRIPGEGRLMVEVLTMPLFDLTLIPFIWSQTQDSSIVELIGQMAADPENHELFADTRALLPIGNLAVTAHEPVLTSTNNARAVLNQTSVIRALEGGTGHYKGMMVRPLDGPVRGVAKLPGRSTFSLAESDVIAHELGHNLGLRHAPCGEAGGPDPSYPYSNGSIGTWGYDFRSSRPVSPSTPDFMSYCGPPDGISDYHFSNALRFRLSAADSVGLPDLAQRTRALLVWGGVGADGVPFLEPAFLVDAPTNLPRSGGAYALSGHSTAGEELFSLGFDMSEVADGDGGSGFALVFPVQPGWERELAGITLSGPGGSVTLDEETDRPAAILRDPRTGTVRGILQDLTLTSTTRADAVASLSPVPGLELLFSRGIPDSEAWNR